MVSTVKISPDEARAILSISESHFHDLKAIEIKPAKLTESVSAFANTAGGELHIGIDEAAGGRGWRGFADIEAANAHLQVLEAMKPLGGHYQATGKEGQ
jgi:ATP-dependent DNA helicase RecG